MQTEYRRPKFNAGGTIDCEINHPAYGWIPFTCDPNDTGSTVDVTTLFALMSPEADAYVAPTPPTEAELLAAERAVMKCTRQQGKLALGPTEWAKVVALAEDPDTPWGLKVAVQDTVEWERMDEDMAALIWAMQLTDEQADDLFRLAMTL